MKYQVYVYLFHVVPAEYVKHGFWVSLQLCPEVDDHQIVHPKAPEEE